MKVHDRHNNGHARRSEALITSVAAYVFHGGRGKKIKLSIPWPTLNNQICVYIYGQASHMHVEVMYV